MAAARHLKGANVEVTLIDRMNHHLFQPLLYQVATGMLSSGECAAPIRGMLRRQANASVLMADVIDVDVARREVVLDRGERVGYDSLIVACGGETSYFGHDEWAQASYPLKRLADAVRLRNQVFSAYEEAEREPDPARRAEWLTFAVVGGGPTGVEISGQLAVLARHALAREYSTVDPQTIRVILLDAGHRVLPTFTEATSVRTATDLAKLGVTVSEATKVIGIDPTGVTVETASGSRRIAARTVVWAAGVRSDPLCAALAKATGAPTDRAGRLRVKPDLTLSGHPEISVIGDAARVDVIGPQGDPVPGLATAAIQQGRHVAEAIRAGHPGATERFTYFDKGALAVIGRGRAVCEVRGHRVRGPLAFLMYLTVHLYYLGGVAGRRITVLTTWIATGLGALQSQVIERTLHHPDSDPGLPSPVHPSCSSKRSTPRRTR